MPKTTPPKTTPPKTTTRKAATRKARGTGPGTDPDETLYALRAERSRTDLWGMLEALYGRHPDYAAFAKALEAAMRAAWRARPADLRLLDLRRDLEPDWFQRPGMAGYVLYVDRFCETLAGLPARLAYLKALGITYVHLMPLLKPRPGENDGGYSVMDYGRIDPRLGTMAEFEEIARECRAAGVSLCIDMVLNHTAREHAWARKARTGDPRFRDYYLMFEDEAEPRAYEETLLEVFPDDAPGNFTWEPEAEAWVWTTFNAHQWDLNWANPQVFLEMTRIMLALANRGVEVLRLDAVAFMWKRMGTRCQSEPEVHMILQALRAACRTVAPAVIHLEEAIVSPSEMLPYLGRGRHDGKEGNLAYHNSLMVQIWGALASRDARLMGHVMRTHFPQQLTNATYATYLRCHDDIGWAVTDEDAGALGLSGAAHRGFLADFYEGAFPGSFATGELFQYNPETGDKRNSGTLASLAGLERALAAGDAEALEAAVHRILMMHALIAGWGGIPLIYMGDEIALLNDYDYARVPEHAHDSRWLHRPRMDWERAELARSDPASLPGRVWHGLAHILARRAATPEFHGMYPGEVLAPEDPALFAHARRAPWGSVVCVYNFSEAWTHVSTDWARAMGMAEGHEALSDAVLDPGASEIALPPHARVWLR